MRTSMLFAVSAAVLATGAVAPAQAATPSAVAPRTAVTKAMPLSCKVLTTTLPWTTAFTVTRTPRVASRLKSTVLTITPTRRYTNGPISIPARQLRPVYRLKVNGVVKTAVGPLIAVGIPAGTPFAVPATRVVFKPRQGLNTVSLVSMTFDHTIVDTVCRPTAAAGMASFRAV